MHEFRPIPKNSRPPTKRRFPTTQSTSRSVMTGSLQAYIRIKGISATNTKHRDGFNRMIADALDGKIDIVLTKSISRFARNTVDLLKTVRHLKNSAFPSALKRSILIRSLRMAN